MTDDTLSVRLNAEITEELKRRLKVYCAREDMDIKEFVSMALENLLDELESGPSYEQLESQ